MRITNAWRQLIIQEQHDFLYFFLPKLARVVNYEIPIIFLSEPARVLVNDEKWMQHNLLLQLQDFDGNPHQILLTLELAGYENRHFEQRLFRDFTACMEAVDYKIPITAFTLFLANFIPAGMNGFEYAEFDTQFNFLYPRYAVREQYYDDLWELENPIAFAVAASRIAIETEGKPTIRLSQMNDLFQRMMHNFKEEILSLEKLQNLLEFTRKILPLAAAQEAQFQTDLINYLYRQKKIAETDKRAIVLAAH